MIDEPLDREEHPEGEGGSASGLKCQVPQKDRVCCFWDPAFLGLRGFVHKRLLTLS